MKVEGRSDDADVMTMLTVLVARNHDDADPVERVEDADNAENANNAALMLILLITMRENVLIILTMLTTLFAGRSSHLEVSAAARPCSSLGSCHLRWELPWPGSTLTPRENVVRMLYVAESCWLKWVVMEILMI